MDDDDCLLQGHDADRAVQPKLLVDFLEHLGSESVARRVHLFLAELVALVALQRNLFQLCSEELEQKRRLAPDGLQLLVKLLKKSRHCHEKRRPHGLQRIHNGALEGVGGGKVHRGRGNVHGHEAVQPQGEDVAQRQEADEAVVKFGGQSLCADL